MDELEEKFFRFKDQLQSLKNLFNDISGQLLHASVLFVLIFAISIPIQLITHNTSFSICTGLSLAFFVLYTFKNNRQKIEDITNEIYSLGDNLDEKDYRDYVYYIEGSGLKKMNTNLAGCVVALIMILVILFFVILI